MFQLVGLTLRSVKLKRIELSKQCKECSYYKIANNQVGGEIIGEDPDIMIIGEAPGSVEDVYNRPFIGPSGKLLREAIESILHRCIITNIVKCYPHGTPNVENSQICVQTHLIPQILEFKPKTIVLVGKIAEDRFPKSVYNGKLVTIPHPAWALRGGKIRQDEWKALVGTTISGI